MAATAMSLDELRRQWRRVAGPIVAAVSWPLMLSNVGCLTVSTASPMWVSELEKHAPTILATLPLIDGLEVRSIRWRYVAPKSPTRERRSWRVR